MDPVRICTGDMGGGVHPQLIPGAEWWMKKNNNVVSAPADYKNVCIILLIK